MNNQNSNIIVKLQCIISTVLKSWRTIIIVALVAGIGLDVYETLTYSPSYVSSLQGVLDLERNTYSQLQQATSYVTTLNYVLNSDMVKEYVMEEIDVDSLDMTCYVYSNSGTNIITIQVYSSSKLISYGTITNLVDWYNDHIEEYQFPYEISVIQEASLNESSTTVNSHRSNFIKGAVAAGALVVIMLALLAYFNSTIKTSEDVDQLLDCRLFARIPKERKKRNGRFWKRNRNAILITSIKTSFQYKEAISKLRTKVLASSERHGYQTIMFTSTLENEGKSSVAANLALSLAKGGKKVLLIDADIRKPSIHKIFNINTEKSLNRFLTGENWVDQLLYLQKQDLFIMCAAQDLKNSEDLISNGRLALLFTKAKQEFDYIIVDTSPSLDLNEPSIISQYVDAVLLVVKQNEASSRTINSTIARLSRVKNNVIGCVYNGSISNLGRSKMYGYRYGYGRYRHEGR